MSVGYGEDLELCGAVVNPIWLFTIICIVPPVLCPLSPDKPKHSEIIP